MYTQTISNDLVSDALTQAGAHSVLAVFRKVEQLSTHGSGLKFSNAAFAAMTGLAQATVSKCLQILSELEVVALVYPENGDKRLREIHFAPVLSPRAVGLLQGLLNGTVTVSIAEARVVMEEPVEGETAVVGPSITALHSYTTNKCYNITAECSSTNKPKEKVEKEKPFDLDALAKELLERAECEREVTIADTGLLAEHLAAGLTETTLRTAVRNASQLPGWQEKRSRRKYCDLQIALCTAELVQRLVDGEQVHPVGCEVPKARQLAVQDIFKAWRRCMGYGAEHMLTQKIFACINARLDEGFTAEQLVSIAQWIAPQPFYRGQNDRNKPYDDPCSIWRSKDRVLQHLRAVVRPGVVDRRHQAMAASDAPVVEERY